MVIMLAHGILTIEKVILKELSGKKEDNINFNFQGWVLR